MCQSPQHAVPARILSTVMPGAQPTLGVVSTGLGAARAPGFPRYDRIIAICSRYERRGLLLWRDAPPRYRRLREAAREALITFPTPRSRRIGSSLAQEMARDYAIHAAILDQLDLRYCPGTCALCDGLASSRADDWPVDHARSRS